MYHPMRKTSAHSAAIFGNYIYTILHMSYKEALSLWQEQYCNLCIEETIHTLFVCKELSIKKQEFVTECQHKSFKTILTPNIFDPHVLKFRFVVRILSFIHAYSKSVIPKLGIIVPLWMVESSKGMLKKSEVIMEKQLM